MGTIASTGRVSGDQVTIDFVIDKDSEFDALSIEIPGLPLDERLEILERAVFRVSVQSDLAYSRVAPNKCGARADHFDLGLFHVGPGQLVRVRIDMGKSTRMLFVEAKLSLGEVEFPKLPSVESYEVSSPKRQRRMQIRRIIRAQLWQEGPMPLLKSGARMPYFGAVASLERVSNIELGGHISVHEAMILGAIHVKVSPYLGASAALVYLDGLEFTLNIGSKTEIVSKFSVAFTESINDFHRVFYLEKAAVIGGGMTLKGTLNKEDQGIPTTICLDGLLDQPL